MQTKHTEQTHQKTGGGIVPSLNALLRRTPAATEPAPKKLKLTAGVICAKGGSGATTLAVNLTAMCAAKGFDACLIDAHFQNPDATVVVGRNPTHSIVEILSRRNDLDERMFRTCAVPLCEGTLAPCLFVSGPADGSAGLAGSLTELAGCIPEFKEYSGVCVIDLPNHLDKHLVNVMDGLDRIILVFEAAANGIAAARRWLSVFADLGYGADKIILVENRSGSKSKIAATDAARLLGRAADAGLPNRFAVIENAILAGQPAVLASPRDRYSQAVSQVADLLINPARLLQEGVRS